jgi:formate dehydrogenase major subunit
MQDLENSDAVMIMGSNMAECHPVAFRWPMKAKLKGAKLIHVDPRFTRTSAVSDIYAPLRSGSDIVFLGGLINYVINSDRWNQDDFFKKYVGNYTNAATLVSEDFKDTEELSGVFSGFDETKKTYNIKSWGYQRDAVPDQPPVDGPLSFSDGLKRTFTGFPKSDPSLANPRSVFQIMKKHYARYTPEMVQRVCGTPPATFKKVADTLLANSGRDKTSSICYAVGWTQHTTGVQLIRTAAMLQLILGNTGRPGGGILALRGHASIQGSTDISTLYHSLPAYMAAPTVLKNHKTLRDYLNTEGLPTGLWVNTPAYFISQLKAWYGDAATRANDFAYEWHAKNIGDHSHIASFVDMEKGTVKGMFALGQNPAVGGQNAERQRKALEKLDWLVARDYFETETSVFWNRKGVDPKQIKTEVFLMPAAHVAEKDGTFTNTQRLIQWHEKAVDPPGASRGEVWFMHHLALRLKALYKGSTLARDKPLQNLTLDYKLEGAIKEPSAEDILKEINGYTWPGKVQLPGLAALKDDGSTACGAWIYSGVFPPEGNFAARRKPGTVYLGIPGSQYVSNEWGFAWPTNRHMLYNRASADPDGKPWSERKKFVWWDGSKWVGYENPDMVPTKAPGYRHNPASRGMDALDGTDPFILKPDGKGWLFAPTGVVDGPLPTHYEPIESPVKNVVYPARQINPVAKILETDSNLILGGADPKYPIGISTYRLTEHYLSGVMSRWLPWLAELMPELFVEISPELAKEKGIANKDWVTIATPRGAVEARALVTSRIRPFNLDGKNVHQIGMPWHWGYQGLVTGDIVNNLSALVLDPNVSIHEGKAFACNVLKGRKAANDLGNKT